MITIFTIPKPFRGDIDIIQKNAIRSWTLLKPKCEIILFGDEKGVSETAKEFGIKHILQIKKNEFGTPLLSSVFNLAKERANNNLLSFVNSDIILMDDFIRAVEEVRKRFSSFLIISQRWNLDIREAIQFNDANWALELRDSLIKNGSGFTGIDCFVFPRNLCPNFPPFLVGRLGWDNWFLYQAHILGIPSIDITKSVIAVHQNHDYSHYLGQKKGRVEIKNNLELLGGISHVFTPREVDWVLTKQGFKKQTTIPLLSYFYRCLGSLPIFYSYFNFLLKITLFPVWLLSKIIIKLRGFVLKRKLPQMKRAML